MGSLSQGANSTSALDRALDPKLVVDNPKASYLKASNPKDSHSNDADRKDLRLEDR